MRDPYSVLGVKREASADEVKRAFRKLAKTWHPDRNADDPKAAARFAEINSAYEIVGDEAKRQQFDRGEIDAEGKPRATFHPGFDPAGQGAGGFRFDFGETGPFGARAGDPRDVFSDLFRRFETGAEAPKPGRSGGRSAIPPGEDIALEAAVPLETIATGGTVRLTLPDLRTLEVKVPAGAANGSTMRLKGQGQASPFGGPNGDALVTIRYQRHPRFLVEGADLRASVPVPLREAILGGSVRVPTLSGEVEVTVPAWTSGGKTLRLRGKGLPLKERTGDLLVTLDIDLGPPDAEIEGFFRRRRV
jgi:DnaJ-class molecular chaperone